jgi:hypothetical protein
MVGGLLSYSYGELDGETGTIRVPPVSADILSHRIEHTVSGDKNASYLGRCWRFCGVWAVSALVSTLAKLGRKTRAPSTVPYCTICGVGGMMPAAVAAWRWSDLWG